MKKMNWFTTSRRSKACLVMDSSLVRLFLTSSSFSQLSISQPLPLYTETDLLSMVTAPVEIFTVRVKMEVEVPEDSSLCTGHHTDPI